MVAMLPYMAGTGPGMSREAHGARAGHCQAISHCLGADGAAAIPGVLGRLPGVNGCARVAPCGPGLPLQFPGLRRGTQELCWLAAESPRHLGERVTGK